MCENKYERDTKSITGFRNSKLFGRECSYLRRCSLMTRRVLCRGERRLDFYYDLEELDNGALLYVKWKISPSIIVRRSLEDGLSC